MAYANSVVFFGWVDKDAKQILKLLCDKEDCVAVEKNIKKEYDDKLFKKVNKTLLEHNITMEIFESGLGEDEVVLYLYFNKQISCQSCSSDHIDDGSLTLVETKALLDASFAFKQKNPKTPQPKLFNYVVSDTK